MATPADNLDSLVASFGAIQGIMSNIDVSIQTASSTTNNSINNLITETNLKLDSLISTVESINMTTMLGLASPIVDIAPIVNELQNISNLITDLDATLVMVGNNIVSQIQMSGATTISTGAIESELIYQTNVFKYSSLIN